MGNTYQDQKTAADYLAFLASANGKIQQQILFNAIAAALPPAAETVILDAGCGPGWLAGKLKSRYLKIYGCDASEYFINIAKTQNPQAEFFTADVTASLPFLDNFFDIIILNMSAPDIADLPSGLLNLSARLKKGGRLIMAVPNPYCTYPVAEWKRTPADVLLGRKPRLKINGPYLNQKNIVREFEGKKIASNFYTLQDYLDASSRAGLTIHRLTELKSQTDSNQFDLNYQMFRYPLILLLEFKK
jgi:SAM-dependent methyltransferase